MSRSLKFAFLVIAALGFTIASLIGMYLYGMGNLQGSFGSGTPEPNRTRGTLLRVIKAGKLSVEVRTYEAGSGQKSANFCDYWVTYMGRDVTVYLWDYQNNYNSCGALLRLQAEKPTILLGSYINSNADYAPIVLVDEGNEVSINANEACAISSGFDDAQQAIKGWLVEGGEVTFCGKKWKVQQHPDLNVQVAPPPVIR